MSAAGNSVSTERSELRPCPCCGDDKPQHMYKEVCQDFRKPQFNKWQSRIWCGMCGLTMIRIEIDDVREAWNARPQPADAAQGLPDRDVLAAIIAPHFSRAAFDAVGGWLDNDARCKALDAADAILTTQRRDPAYARQQDNDLGILISVLRNFEDAVGENIDDTEGVVAQIEADYLARVVVAQEGSVVSSTTFGGAAPDVEIERLRAVAWAAQGMLNADTYVSDIPREQAVREADLKLRQALGTWQMHHTAASAHSSINHSGGA